mmetsp:Transcript_17555/g.26021  ORF Transcript_17555/g.26021 Transcript_17555/m.26021 type:complete len:83 (+) Transcript_17555:128-376(+)
MYRVPASLPYRQDGTQTWGQRFYPVTHVHMQRQTSLPQTLYSMIGAKATMDGSPNKDVKMPFVPYQSKTPAVSGVIHGATLP